MRKNGVKSKLEEQLKLAEENNFPDIVIPVTEAKAWLCLLESYNEYLKKTGETEHVGINLPV